MWNSRGTLYSLQPKQKNSQIMPKIMVVSDKQLVKHLQKEVKSLEAVLRTPEFKNSLDGDEN